MPRVAVIVATLGRPGIVSATLGHLSKTQSLKPAEIIVSCATPEDAGDAIDLPGVTVVTGPTGLPKQRNTALGALPADQRFEPRQAPRDALVFNQRRNWEPYCSPSDRSGERSKSITGPSQNEFVSARIAFAS